MTRQEWVEEALRVLIEKTGPWENGLERQFAEGLYDTYVEDSDEDYDPEDAVLEELTYWEDGM